MMTKALLKAGTCVHLYGIPVALLNDTEVETNEGNWEQIQAAKQAIDKLPTAPLAAERRR